MDADRARTGTRIAIVEAASGQEKVEIETPAGVKATLTDESGGKITLEAAGNTITMDTQGVSVQAGAKVKVSAGQVEVSAGQVTVNAGISQFSGVVSLRHAGGHQRGRHHLHARGGQRMVTALAAAPRKVHPAYAGGCPRRLWRSSRTTRSSGRSATRAHPG